MKSENMEKTINELYKIIEIDNLLSQKQISDKTGYIRKLRINNLFKGLENRKQKINFSFKYNNDLYEIELKYDVRVHKWDYSKMFKRNDKKIMASTLRNVFEEITNGEFIDETKEYTYLMTDGKYYKIGKSNNPKKRLKQLRTANINIKIVCFGTGVKENFLHKFYDNKRLELEWFDLTPNEVEYATKLIKKGDLRVRGKKGHSVLTAKEILKTKDAKRKKQFNVKKYIINFGKYRDRMLYSMTDEEEIKYCFWVWENHFKDGEKNNIKFKAFERYVRIHNKYKNDMEMFKLALKH